MHIRLALSVTDSSSWSEVQGTVYICTLHACLLEYYTDLVHVILLQQCVKLCVEFIEHAHHLHRLTLVADCCETFDVAEKNRHFRLVHGANFVAYDQVVGHTTWEHGMEKTVSTLIFLLEG